MSGQQQVQLEQEAQDTGVNIKDEILKYLKFWKWFVLAACIGTLLAFVYLRFTPETYRSFAKIKILDESSSLELSTGKGGSLFSDTKNLDNEIEVIRSKRLLEKVVDSLDLHIRYFFEGKFKQQEAWGIPFKFISVLPNEAIRGGRFYVEVLEHGFKIRKGEDFDTEFITDSYNVNNPLKDFPFLITSNPNIKNYIGFLFRIDVQSIASAAAALSYQIGINRVGATDILQLNLVGENRKRSEAILNKVAEQFNRDGVEDRQLVFQRTIDFVDERFVFLAEELDSIEVDKKEFQQHNNMVSFNSDIGYSMSKKTGTESAVLDVENQIALSKLLINTLSDNDLGTLLPQSIGLGSVGANGLVDQYNKVILEREALITSAGDNNPKVIALNEQLEELRTNLYKSLAVYQKQLDLSLTRFKIAEEGAIGLVKNMPEKEKILRSIERQQNLKENLYLLLLQKREQAAINLAITAPSIKVIEYAASSGKPVSPDSKGIYIKSILGALVIPFGIIFLLFKLDTKVHDKSDVVKSSKNIPIAGEIPKMIGNDKLFSNPHDRTMLAESFRILSTNLNFILPVNENKAEAQVIYVTSSIKGEGKTFVSVNLALAYSSISKKVLLIGADLRNPKIKVTGQKKHDKGLSDVLYDGELNWKSVLQDSSYNKSHLDVLIAGTIPPNPAELLSNGKLKQIIEEAKLEYDYIIIDTAPVVPVTDTLLISQYADVSIYVVRAGYTEKKLLGFSKEIYNHNKLNNMAYVVNDISEAKSSRGYGYNYGYGYGYNNETVVNKYSWTGVKTVIKNKLR
ncbi:GumC family protein, partial [Formosa sp. S-31]|uniref:GumC family protein n=1 Tax=Formosa sp. S-31 TaxID=2790949 RepID=UPI003EBE5CA7